jgi:hypothetical protein
MLENDHRGMHEIHTVVIDYCAWETKTLENAKRRRLPSPSRRLRLGVNVRTTFRLLEDRRRAKSIDTFAAAA